MRLALATVLMVLSIVGCRGVGVVNSIPPPNTSTPFIESRPTIAVGTTQATAAASPTASTTATSTTPRSSTVTRTPAAAAPLPTLSDGLPLPVDARETKNIPESIRSFLQTQLKGQKRVGQAQGYLSPHPVDEVFNQYQSDLKAQGWESVPLVGNLPENMKLVIAQKSVRAFVAFMDQGGGQTLVYLVTTQR